MRSWFGYPTLLIIFALMPVCTFLVKLSYFPMWMLGKIGYWVIQDEALNEANKDLERTIANL